jgi:hypothetical protein
VVRWGIALGVSLVACGRIGFDAVPTDGTVDDAAVWVGSFVTTGTASGTTDTFTARAQHVGDAVVVHGYCYSTARPTAVSLTSPGWSFALLGAVAGEDDHMDWAAAFGAIAPDTDPATFTITWSVGDCAMGTDTLGDELGNVDPAGGATTFYASATTYGTGDCIASVDVAGVGDMIWAACSASVQAAGPGFMKSVDDHGGDWTEYAVASATGPTQATFTNTPGRDFIETAVAVKHR